MEMFTNLFSQLSRRRGSCANDILYDCNSFGGAGKNDYTVVSRMYNYDINTWVWMSLHNIKPGKKNLQ